MKKKFLPLVTLLFLYLGMAGTLDAQEPVFAEPIDNAFGLEYAAEPGQRVWVRLVDIDGDGILEAFVLKGNPDTPCCGDVEYYENEGTTENPHFVFSQNYPFGMPQEETIWAYQFVDIDGDGDFDLSYFQFDLDAPVRILRNKGTASAPDFSGNFEENPFGISLPESELEPGNLLDVVTPVFADYDQDGDVDLMLNGLFLNAEEDEGYYFSENIGTPTQPQFDAPEKNPFELDYPGGSYHQSAFVDLDCDGDQDLYTIVVNSPFPEVNLRFYENTKTLQGEPQFDEEPLLWYPINTVDYRFLPASGTFLDKDGDGDLDFICGEFGIHFWENLSAPEVDFSHVQVGGKFAFTDSSSLIVGDPTAWHWDFGDGNTSDVQNPTHTYLEDGTYEVCLTVWGNLNCHNTVCKTIITKVFPWHTFPVLNDNDGIQEAFILLFDFKNHFDPASCPPHKWWCWWDFKYYENNGTDAAPDFQYQESFPFGIPYDSLYWPSQFIDLDGDGD
ncbi:MAG: FG-GAP-like repeat-containing protein, partial [Calditrichia bacterium]